MPQPTRDRDRDPLAATRRLLVDGSNLLHAMSRKREASPPATLVGRLRAAIPAATAIELVFDGPSERAMRNERIAAGIRVRYGGHRSADAVILGLVDDVLQVDGADGAAGLLVVTDDRDLKHAARTRGARTAGSAWLLGRLDARRLAAPSVGNRRSPTVPATAPDDDPDRPGWQPGRGATTKRGNPKRAPRTGRAGRMPP